MQAFLLKSHTKDYLWGGDTLRKRWGKTAEGRVAESWEFSLYPEMESVVSSGEYAGKNLKELYDAHPELFGEKVKEFPIFPLLIKLIDARENLSVQVHPSDFYALTHAASLGKTEVWYVAEAREGAALYWGFNRTVTEGEVREALANGQIEALLNRVAVKAGDSVFVRAGTVHAILAGVTVFEVQENSNLTYRLYDYNRTDASGKPRELHLEQALEVINFDPPKPYAAEAWVEGAGYRTRQVAKCRYFSVRAVQVTSGITLGEKDCFGTFTVTEGNLKLDGTPICKGDTAMIPAGATARVDGVGTLLYTTIE